MTGVNHRIKSHIKLLISRFVNLRSIGVRGEYATMKFVEGLFGHSCIFLGRKMENDLMYLREMGRQIQ